MTIRRDDLVAAAAVGLLQYRQIDPLLVFLLQRDVVARRQAMLEQARKRPQDRLNAMLSYVVALLAVVTAALFAVLFTTRAVQSIGIGALVFLAVVYLVVALGVTAWLRKRGYTGRLRVIAALLVAVAPLAFAALQHVGA
ncbi:MAG TPA: hypothetical protein VGE12_02480 [Noviherbaspirillum sp.]